MKSQKIASIVAIAMMAAVLAVPGFAQEVSTNGATVSEQSGELDFDDEVVTETELSVVEQEYNTSTDPEGVGYPFKRLGEFFQDVFTFDPDAKVRLRIQFAKERLSEANIMAQRGKHDRAAELIREHETNVDEIEVRIRERVKMGSDVSRIARDTEESTAKSALVLALVKEKVPDQAKAAIERAINKSLEKKARVEAAADVSEEIKDEEELTDAEIEARIKAKYEARLRELLKKHEERLSSLEHRFQERLEKILDNLERRIAEAEESGREEQAEALRRIRSEAEENLERKRGQIEESRERTSSRIAEHLVRRKLAPGEEPRPGCKEILPGVEGCPAVEKNETETGEAHQEGEQGEATSAETSSVSNETSATSGG